MGQELNKNKVNSALLGLSFQIDIFINYSEGIIIKQYVSVINFSYELRRFSKYIGVRLAAFSDSGGCLLAGGGCWVVRGGLWVKLEQSF